MATGMPAARRRSAPCAARALGSASAATTRPIPAAMTVSVQGGVRPVWLQGSSVTYIVAPRGLRPRAATSASAFASACGAPARSCQPSPITVPSATITQPTRGFGVVV